MNPINLINLIGFIGLIGLTESSPSPACTKKLGDAYASPNGMKIL